MSSRDSLAAPASHHMLCATFSLLVPCVCVGCHRRSGRGWCSHWCSLRACHCSRREQCWRCVLASHLNDRSRCLRSHHDPSIASWWWLVLCEDYLVHSACVSRLGCFRCLHRQSSLLCIVGFLPRVHGVRPLLSPDVVEAVKREVEALTSFWTTSFPEEGELTLAYGRLREKAECVAGVCPSCLLMHATNFGLGMPQHWFAESSA